MYIFELFEIKETLAQLQELEKKVNPLLIKRVRWLIKIKTNPTITPSELATTVGINEFQMDRWAALYRFGGIDVLLDIKTLESTPNTSKTFSQHAKDMLQELYSNHPNQLGRQLWVDFELCRKNKTSGPECSSFGEYEKFYQKFVNWRRTDCQTYIQDVLKYAFEKTGKRVLYDGLLRFYKKNGTTGTSMARYLVSIGWKAYLFMPDTEKPSDNNPEHTQMYRNSVRTKKWWEVPLSGFIVNYNPTAPKTPPDVEGRKNLLALTDVLFAACVFTKGIHTGILSEGNILEVHWKQISEQTEVEAQYQNFQNKNTLYEKTNLLDFEWIEGIFVIPPDSKVKIG